MFKRFFLLLRNYDWLLLLSILLLLSFGLAALYGIAVSFDEPNFTNFFKQIIFSILGITAALALSFIDYNFFRQYAYFFALAAGLLMVAVLFFGTSLSGTTGWFRIFGGFTFQPVEVAKIALIFFMARFCSDSSGKDKDWKFILSSGIVAGMFFLLTSFQPDLGSSLILFAIWFVMLIISGIRKTQIVWILVILLALFFVGWVFFFQDYQKDRILTFIHPGADPYGRGYHVRQAIIGVGSGQLFGRGLASGSQSQLKFIPASQTDFIFAVIAEELGLVGASLLMTFYVIVFFRFFVLAKRVHDNFAFFTLCGIAVLFFTHFFVNVGMNVGLLPVTGIGLPFVSYGGSFLIASFSMLGIVQAIARRRM